MKASLLKLQRRKAKPQRGPKSNFRVVVFAICVVVSFGFWLMNMLSKKYTQSILFYIQYQHMPASPSGNKMNVTDTMRIKVTTSGFRLTGYKFGIFEKLIIVDASQFHHKDNQYYYTLNNHIHEEKIEEQLGEEVKILDITPDTLYIRPSPTPDKS